MLKKASVVALVAVAALFAATLAFYALPSLPQPRGDAVSSQNAGYTAGGGACKPTQLAKLKGAQAATERDRCAQAAEDHRIQLSELDQTALQARGVLLQLDLLVLALIAASWAAWEARIAAIAIKQQVKLARDEFEAAHRPWIAIRGVEIASPCIHLGEISIEATVTYILENTSDVPAINVGLIGRIAPRSVQGEVQGMQDEHIENYRAIGYELINEHQNMIIFPGDRNVEYSTKLEAYWRGVDDSDKRHTLSTEELSDLLLIVAFFYSDPSDATAVRYSTCVHEITCVLTDKLVDAAKAGTGILLNGNITRWSVGWRAA